MHLPYFTTFYKLKKILDLNINPNPGHSQDLVPRLIGYILIGVAQW